LKKKKSGLAPMPAVAPADPSQWSEKSQGSVAATFRTFYTDKTYRCRYCGKDAVFTAREQKLVYEVKKTHIDVQRVLCEPCWRECGRVAKRIAACEAKWAESKKELASDAKFLAEWRDLLEEHCRYGARANGAAMNMLRKLLEGGAGAAAARGG
jgi:hypothetical protein